MSEQELRELFVKHGYPKMTQAELELIPAILKWNDKQIEEVIKKPNILPKGAQHQESVKQGINFYHRQMRKRVSKVKGGRR